MVCTVSCSISLIFIIGMIYFYSMTYKSQVAEKYRASLSPELRLVSDKITKERMQISLEGYGLGLLLSIGLIYYFTNEKKQKMDSMSLVCLVVAVSFLTNYFYYVLHKKSDWMIKHLKDKKDIDNWLQMYRFMQYHYHLGIVLGIIGVGMLAYAFC